MRTQALPRGEWSGPVVAHNVFLLQFKYPYIGGPASDIESFTWIAMIHPFTGLMIKHDHTIITGFCE
jgi:hypothetical protein